MHPLNAALLVISVYSALFLLVFFINALLDAFQDMRMFDEALEEAKTTRAFNKHVTSAIGMRPFTHLPN